MSVTVIKEGDALRILEATQPIPEGTRLVLFTAGEQGAGNTLSALESAQLESIFAGDDEDWSDVLAPLRKPSP